jgi:hypothetical protein
MADRIVSCGGGRKLRAAVGIVALAAAAISCDSCIRDTSARRNARLHGPGESESSGTRSGSDDVTTRRVPRDSGGRQPSAAEVQYLSGKVRQIASAWVAGDAQAFLGFWSRDVDLGLEPQTIMSEIEEMRSDPQTAGPERKALSFMRRFGVVVVPASQKEGAERRNYLRSELTRRLLEGDLKRYFGGLDPGELLAVETILRNPVSTLDDESPVPEKEGWIPGVWVVRAAVSQEAQQRDFAKVVTFYFRYGGSDWELSGMQAW